MKKFLSKITAIAISGLSITCVSMTTVNAQNLQIDHNEQKCDFSITEASLKCCQKNSDNHQDEYLIENHSPKHNFTPQNDNATSAEKSKFLKINDPRDQQTIKNRNNFSSKTSKITIQKNE